jgi:type III pantothenate kinase
MPNRDAYLVIAVDSGSTRTHVGLVDTGRRTCLFRRDFLSSETDRSLPEALGRIKNIISSAPAVIAGGHQPAVEKIMRKYGQQSITRLSWRVRLPLRFRYVRPETLGADRIADALYAAAVYPQRNVIIIDAGTAITVDAVSRSAEFAGGTILAGTGIQLYGLHAAAGALRALPVVALSGKKIPFPGNSTEQCMQAGAAHGTAGALNHLVRMFRSSLGGKCLVLATGGGWLVTRNLVDFKYVEVPAMTLIGTALYALYPQR